MTFCTHQPQILHWPWPSYSHTTLSTHHFERLQKRLQNAPQEVLGAGGMDGLKSLGADCHHVVEDSGIICNHLRKCSSDGNIRWKHLIGRQVRDKNGNKTSMQSHLTATCPSGMHTKFAAYTAITIVVISGANSWFVTLQACDRGADTCKCCGGPPQTKWCFCQRAPLFVS